MDDGQQENIETKRISKATLALICFTFLFFFFGLKLVVSIEMSLCSECSFFLVYDPLVIADAAMLLLVFIALAYVFETSSRELRKIKGDWT